MCTAHAGEVEACRLAGQLESLLPESIGIERAAWKVVPAKPGDPPLPKGFRSRCRSRPPVEIPRAPWTQDSSFSSQFAFASSMSLSRQAHAPASTELDSTISVSGAPIMTKPDLLFETSSSLSPASLWHSRCVRTHNRAGSRYTLTNGECPLSTSR